MNATILANGKELQYSSPLIMGIVNCTPDSFAEKFPSTELAVENAGRMISEGVDILDIGGESSRPGSDQISADEELKRILPVIQGIRSVSGISISIDTTKAVVARKALEAGADIINDISALAFDPSMVDIVIEHKCPVVLMHLKGIPKTMQETPYYDDVIKEVSEYFTERIGFAVSHGIDKQKLILDIGIGFGKRKVDNLKLLKNLNEFTVFDLPLLIGASRKRFIGDIVGIETEDRMPGSITAAVLAVEHGARIVRVHDVAETRQALKVSQAIKEV